jgi:general secretion pathway protein G
MRMSRKKGFTLIEMLIVIMVMGVLLSIALPQYKVALIQSREATLKADLFHFRDAIDQYQIDKGHYPATLDALVTDGYLRAIPPDPVSGAADWREVPSEPDPDSPQDVPGVQDVKSSSSGTSLSGTPYSEW